jgi:hypothetical protein
MTIGELTVGVTALDMAHANGPYAGERSPYSDACCLVGGIYQLLTPAASVALSGVMSLTRLEGRLERVPAKCGRTRRPFELCKLLRRMKDRSEALTVSRQAVAIFDGGVTRPSSPSVRRSTSAR